jgi:DNA polymerase-3 subunit gamma/tau
VIAGKADGAMRDALTIFDQTVAFCGTDIHYEDVIRNLNVLDYEYSFSMVENFLSGNYGAALSSFDEVLRKGFNALHFVAALSSHLRDLVVARTAGLDALLELPDSLKKRYQEQAARCPLQFLYDALNVTTACEAGYKAAVNPRLHIEFALMKLSFLTGRSEVSTAPRPVQAPAAAPAPAPAAPAAAPAPAPKPAPAVAPKPAPAPAPAPAPEPKPAPAPEPKPEPKPAPERRRKPKTGSALSMNALMEEKEEAPVTETVVQADTALPADDAVRQKWTDLVAMYANRQRLASALSTTNLTMSEEGGVKIVSFTVLNTSQKQWIEEKLLRELETNFRQLLSCQKVNLVIEVAPDTAPSERAPYMPEEKAKDLMDKNPEVRAFVADLGLDTK